MADTSADAGVVQSRFPLAPLVAADELTGRQIGAVAVDEVHAHRIPMRADALAFVARPMCLRTILEYLQTMLMGNGEDGVNVCRLPI